MTTGAAVGNAANSTGVRRRNRCPNAPPPSVDGTDRAFAKICLFRMVREVRVGSP